MSVQRVNEQFEWLMRCMVEKHECAQGNIGDEFRRRAGDRAGSRAGDGDGGIAGVRTREGYRVRP